MPMEELARLYDINKKTLSHYYIHITSDFAKDRPENWWPWVYQNISKRGWINGENVWERMCIDEKNISGEVYTILSNSKEDKIVAILPGTSSQPIVEKLKLGLNPNERDKGEEISMDMSGSMELIVENTFWKAIKVTDRFHVIKNILEDLTAIKIRVRTVIKKEELDFKVVPFSRQIFNFK